MRIVKVDQNTALEQKTFEKASATVIADNSLVSEDSGLIIAAVDASAKLAYCVGGAISGETTVDVIIGNNFEIEINADEAFAKTHRDTEVDLVVSGTEQKADLGASTTDAFRVVGDLTAGTVGSLSNVRVRINKPIF